MNWWNQTRLVGLHGQLITRLRRWVLPYMAVFHADLSTLARSWVLRAWFVLTMLVGLVTMLNRGGSWSPAESPSQTGTVLAALLSPPDSSSGEAHMMYDLLKFYIVIWVSFIVVLTGGTISSELGVVADSVLSRGISRWQYFLGKWTSRLTAVLLVYSLVVVPISLVLWVTAAPARPLADEVASADFQDEVGVPQPGPLPERKCLTLGGVTLGVAQVAAVLGFVVTCSVGFSANFGSTVISIAVGWVSIYGTGLVLSLLDLSRFSPARMLRDLPDLLRGHYVARDQYELLGGWMALSLLIAIASGCLFARRDV